MNATLGIVEKAVVEVCVHCGKSHGVVLVRGLKGSGWSQHLPHGCFVTTTKGPGPMALSDLVDAEVFGDGGVA